MVCLLFPQLNVDLAVHSLISEVFGYTTKLAVLAIFCLVSHIYIYEVFLRHLIPNTPIFNTLVRN